MATPSRLRRSRRWATAEPGAEFALSHDCRREPGPELGGLLPMSIRGVLPCGALLARCVRSLELKCSLQAHSAPRSCFSSPR